MPNSKIPLALLLAQMLGNSCKDAAQVPNTSAATATELFPYTQCLLTENFRDNACRSGTRGISDCMETTCKPDETGACAIQNYMKVKAAMPATYDECYPGYPVDV